MNTQLFTCPNCSNSYSHKHTLKRHQRTCKVVLKQIPLIASDAKTPQPPVQITNITNITNNITNNNITIYFNKDLKYFKELVDVMGRQDAISYLLYTLPTTKNLFDVMGKIFVREGVNCPISLTAEGEFIISRGEGKTEIDPTGALIDMENKTKIKDAVLTAFVNNNKIQTDALHAIRLAQMQDRSDHFRSYTAKESAVLNSTYETHLEPSRLYEILDMITAIKTKKQDYDALRRMIVRYSSISKK